jgi:hypothetical protein
VNGALPLRTVAVKDPCRGGSALEGGGQRPHILGPRIGGGGLCYGRGDSAGDRRGRRRSVDARERGKSVRANERASARAGLRAAAFRSIAWFARSDDNGATYDLVKPILDPGNKAQTIGNQIVVLPNGDLVMLFNLIRNVGAKRNRGFTAAVMRSTDKGETWSAPIEIDRMITDGVTDPADGHAVRTGDLIPQIAVDDNSGAVYLVWQDDRFTGQEQIAFSSSTDGGRTWSATRRISTVGGVNQAFVPTVRVADNGTVAVQHYDFRFDDPTTTPAAYDRRVAAALGRRRRHLDRGADRQRDPGVVVPGEATGSFDHDDGAGCARLLRWRLRRPLTSRAAV